MSKNLKKFLVFGFILAVVLILFMYSGAITDIFLGLFGRGEGVVLRPVAVIEQVTENVKLKRSVSTEWNYAKIRKKLGVLDSLSTGDRSTSMIKFNNGFNFSLLEKSLVVIEDPKDTDPNVAAISLTSGSFTLNNATNTAAVVRLRSGDKVIEVKGKAQASIKVDKATGQTKVLVRKGQAKVRDTFGNEETVSAGETSSFVASPVEAPTPIITPPPPPPEPKVESIPGPQPELVPMPEPVKEEPKPARTLTKDDIYRTLAKYSNKLNACYDKRIDFVKGRRLLISVSIENTGRVLAIKTLRSETKDKTTDSCLRNIVQNVKFQEFDGEPITEKVHLVFTAQ